MGADVYNYYQQNHCAEDSNGYESDSDNEEDNGPYWKVSLHANQQQPAYANNYHEDEEEDYYAEPAYEVYPAERSSTQIAQAHEKASQIPEKAPPDRSLKEYSCHLARYI